MNEWMIVRTKKKTCYSDDVDLIEVLRNDISELELRIERIDGVLAILMDNHPELFTVEELI